MSNSVSFNNYPIKLAEKVLKIGPYDDFLEEQISPTCEFIDLCKPPSELYEQVFHGLANVLKSTPFPKESRLEGNVSDFVYAFLNPIVQCVEKEVNAKLLLKFKGILPEKADSAIELLENSSADVDYIIQHNDGLNSKRTYLVIVEIKSGIISLAYLPCMLRMLRAFELNFKSEPNSPKSPERLVYGICTNGVHMTVISFNGNFFRMLFPRIIMFPSMKKTAKRTVTRGDQTIEEMYFEYEADWLEKYSEMVDVIYSCLIKVASDTAAN